MTKYILTIFLFLTLLVACTNPTGLFSDGLHPQYFTQVQIGAVHYNNFLDKQASAYSPDEYFYKNYYLKTEYYEGIHLLKDIGDSYDSLFWPLPGITTFTIDNETLSYTMKTSKFKIPISDINQPSLMMIETNQPFDSNSMSPFNADGHFECVDTTQGYIRSWKQTDLYDLKCWK